MNQLNPAVEEQQESKQPRIVLVTDFVSTVFIYQFHNATFLKQINQYDFQVIVIGNDSANYYFNASTLQHKQIIVAKDFNSIPTERVCESPGNVYLMS